MPRQNPLYQYNDEPDPCDPVEIPVESGGNPFPVVADDIDTQAVLGPSQGETTTMFSGPPVEFVLDDDWTGYMSVFPEIADDLS